MMRSDEEPILIACGECTSRVEKTFRWLSENRLLECPVCGRNMGDERAAVVDHVETIRRTIAESLPERERT
jgi:DNA-directed RNA polymerase subunit RPC12/RpoP